MPLRIIPIALLIVIPAFGQQTDSSWLNVMREAYRQLDYARTESAARSVLNTFEGYSINELTEAHTTLGLVMYAQNRQDGARRHFEAALSLDGGLELDSLMVSPKIMAFFEDVRAEATSRDRENDPVEIVRYIRQEDPRPAAALRSMIAPGLGQLYKAERKKGWILLGAWGGAVAATTTAHVLRQNARNSYLDARDPLVIAGRYETYNRRHKIRNGLALAAAGIWLYSYIDALVKPAILPEASSSKTSITLSPYLEAPYTQFSISYSF